MRIQDLIGPTAVFVGIKAGDKRRVLETLSERAAALVGLDPLPVLEALSRREELGSTGMGEGAAIPHARVAGVEKPIGLFARLKSPVAFEAVDDRPVDLVCLLLLPTTGTGSEPLSALACVARRLRDPDLLNRMRRAPDDAALYQVLLQPPSA